VRRIFQSVLAGETIASIAKALRAEKIPIPSEHWKRAGEPVRAAKYADPYAWSATTIGYNLVQGKWVEDAFICSGYRHLIHDCTMHHIPTVKIEAAILAVIQRVSWYVRHNEKEFIERVREASDQNQEKTVKECKQKINKSQKRHKELDGLVKKLYEGNATGKIPDKHFTRLLAEYDEEQTGLETSIAEWQRQIENWNADKLKTDQFIQLVKRYTDFSELTTPMLNEFIEKVIVYEGEGRGNDRRQRIDIYLNFIGAFEVPAHIVTPEELEAEEKRLAHSREWQKERWEKRKAAEPPKPPKKKSIKELMELEKTGAELTPEESERLEAHKSRKKIAREKLVQQAATDPAAAAELAKKRAHQSQATKKSRQKMYEEAATGNPEAVERYENYLVTRRESYHRKKQEAERTA